MTDQIKFANDKSAGEKLVGIDFNPGNIGDVAECKQRFAQAINQVIAHKDDVSSTLKCGRLKLLLGTYRYKYGAGLNKDSSP